jgi:UDP-N-acetylmuramoylalanine--D-glutamate ligase
VCRALSSRDIAFVAIDDRPAPDAHGFVESVGGQMIEAPTTDQLTAALATVDLMLPTPGLPEAHEAFAVARDLGLPIGSEFDLAREWDDRPLLAVTGTNGKTTVTEWATQMLEASGRRAMAVGNTDTPLVTAIDDATTEIFVVEASSFRLAHTQRFVPRVATWLNFGPDHLDVHASLETYEAAKARIWRDQSENDVAVVNVDDPVVMRNRPTKPTVKSIGSRGDYREHNGALWSGDVELLSVDELWRTLPHDCFDALAAAATVESAGATLDGIRSALRDFRGLAHRVELVATSDDVSFYDDSKATTPHAVSAALAGFASVVLIAGGRNKGIDLVPLADRAEHIRAVVAIGESGDEVATVFDGLRPVVTAESMEAAVTAARGLARPGDVILLSPGCASYDWYPNYGARGDEFAAIVSAQLGGTV